MSKKLYIAIDVQNDFIRGSLGSDWAKSVTPKIAKFLATVKDKEDTVGIWATRDTHFNKESVGEEFEKDGKRWNSEISEACWYENTLEGKKLPVEHCIKDTWGWEIDEEVMKHVTPHRVYDKHTFMSYYLGRYIGNFMKDIKMDMSHEIDEIVLMGFCTSICVISNALYIRGLFPDMKITVIDNLCGDVSKEAHEAALTVMRNCQIDIETVKGLETLDIEGDILRLAKDKRFYTEEIPVNLDSRFIEDLGFDSLDSVEFIMTIEEMFAIAIEDKDAEACKTVGDAVKLVKSLV